MPKAIHLLTIALTFLILAVPVQSYSPTDAEMNSETPRVHILYANYLDLDFDGNEDDILTMTWIQIPSHYEVIETKIESDLILPSLHTYQYDCATNDDFNYMLLILFWYNSATEGGWYTLNVDVTIHHSDGVDFGSDTLVFDPPEGGDPGNPITEAYNVTG